MLYLSPAKINLFLSITSRRLDGYHNLQSLFSRINLYDKINLNLITNNIIRTNNLHHINIKHDLSLKAACALKNYAIIHNIANADNLGIAITLNKNIPVGAGLGGGSSNAATILLQLNKLWNLNFSNNILQNIGLQLGADIPFFIQQKSALIEGIGEKIYPLHLPSLYLIIFKPNVYASTKQIFNHKKLIRNNRILLNEDLRQELHSYYIEKNSKQFINKCLNLGNTMQAVVLELFPHLKTQLNSLQRQLNTKLQMTGSGSCFFAMFNTEQARSKALGNLNLPFEWSMYICQTLT